MEGISQFLHTLKDPRSLEQLIQWGGYLILAAIIFAETGLLVGFFLPGDSLLVTAGFLAAQPALSGHLNIVVLIVLLCVAAIAGNGVGYWVGVKVGPPLFARPNSRLFNREHLQKTQAFYEKHGGKAIILARFVPIVRTFVPVVAGVARMDYRLYMKYNLWSGMGWVTSMCLLGYGLGTLGQRFAFIKDHIEIVVLAVVFLSLVPGFLHILKERRHKSVPAAQPRETTSVR
jgi:membrane-associated protein